MNGNSNEITKKKSDEIQIRDGFSRFINFYFLIYSMFHVFP